MNNVLNEDVRKKIPDIRYIFFLWSIWQPFIAIRENFVELSTAQ